MPTSAKTDLSPKEIVVMELLTDPSLTYDDIARTLGISRSSVNGRLRSVRDLYAAQGMLRTDRSALVRHYNTGRPS
jgi:DNA-binding CsgD family transcriptional regulator